MPILPMRPARSVADLCRVQAVGWLLEVSAALSRGVLQHHLIHHAASAWLDAAELEPSILN
jgi:hypothetical protein